MSQEMAAKRKSRLKHKQEGILNQLTVVVYGALSHVVEEHPVPNQHVKRAYRQNQALWAREMKTGNPLPAVRKSPKLTSAPIKAHMLTPLNSPKTIDTIIIATEMENIDESSEMSRKCDQPGVVGENES